MSKNERGARFNAQAEIDPTQEKLTLFYPHLGGQFLNNGPLITGLLRKRQWKALKK